MWYILRYWHQFHFRLPVWGKLDIWEDTCPWVTVESEDIESMVVVAVTPVACIITESNTRNSKWLKRAVNAFLLFSHPGYFGKKGIRHFHLKRNQYHCPSLNLEKLWTLVSEESRKSSTESKAVVIDVVKSVSTASNSFVLSNYNFLVLRATSKCSVQVVYPTSPVLFVQSNSQSSLKSASKP
jgi:hypothetical protein